MLSYWRLLPYYLKIDLASNDKKGSEKEPFSYYYFLVTVPVSETRVVWGKTYGQKRKN